MKHSLGPIFAFAAFFGVTAPAQQPDPNPNPGNPIVETLRAADPDVHVWDNVVWMYTSQDQPPLDGGTTGYSGMDGYHAFSSTDLVNWTDHGEILHSRDVAWGIDTGGWMWAPGAARKGDSYFLYYPHKNQQGEWRIGVATADQPQGPFTDSGSFIAGTSGIDPMVFTDDDGASYLYFGSNKVARLSDDMLSLAESPRTIDYGANNFREGAWTFKKEEKYYYTYTDWQNPTLQGYYAIGDSPYGPFEYQGAMAPRGPGAQDHHSIVQYMDQWYYFYHVGTFTDADGVPGAGNRRNAAIEYLHFNPDGTIQMVVPTAVGVGPVKPPTPSQPKGDYLGVINIDFGSGPLQQGVAGAEVPGPSWNRMTSSDGAGALPLIDGVGAQSPVRVAFDSISQYNNPNTAAEVGALKQYSALMQDYLFASSPKTFTVSGLDPAELYDFCLYGQGDQVGQSATFVVQGNARSTAYDPGGRDGLLAEGIEYVRFERLQPDSAGRIQITLSGAGGLVGFNGLQILRFAPGLAGDFNDDGRVDAADYTSWRDRVGETSPQLPNDIDGGIIDERHYETWRARYGAREPVASPAIPEAGGIGLVASGIGIGLTPVFVQFRGTSVSPNASGH